MFRMFSEVGVHAMSCMHLFLQLETVLALTLVIYHECISQRPRDFTSCFCCCSCYPAVQPWQSCVTGSLRLCGFCLQSQMVQAMPVDTFLQVIGSAIDSPALRLHVSANRTMGACIRIL